MRSPVQALIWEQWRQVRLPIAFGVALTVAASWSIHYAMTVALQWTASPRWSTSTPNFGLRTKRSWRGFRSFSLWLRSYLRTAAPATCAWACQREC